MATDIASVIGVMALLGSRVPRSEGLLNGPRYRRRYRSVLVIAVFI